jgi:hypothetical protein
MRVKGLSKEQMNQALTRLNKYFKGNILFNRFDVKGNWIHFTLRVKDSKKAGANISHNGYANQRRTISACWHVHGMFFVEIFNINPAAKIWSWEQWVKKNNIWRDYNNGSMMQPSMKSSCCDCP